MSIPAPGPIAPALPFIISAICSACCMADSLLVWTSSQWILRRVGSARSTVTGRVVPGLGQRLTEAIAVWSTGVGSRPSALTTRWSEQFDEVAS